MTVIGKNRGFTRSVIFLLISWELFAILTLSTQQLRLHFGRLDFPSWRLSPIGAYGTRYHRHLEKEFWRSVPAYAVGAQDTYVIMLPDLEKYRPYIAELDLTPAQQDKLIHSLWLVMESFADQAFGIHPAQQALPMIAQGDCSAPDRALGFSQDAFADKFNAQAGDKHTNESD